MDNAERYQQLASKWLDGTITEEEKKEFSKWYNSHNDDEFFIPTSFARDEAELRNRILLKVKQGLHPAPSRETRISSKWWAVAASIALFLLGGITYLVYEQQDNQVVQTVDADDILPGGNRATLTLADGKVIHLNDQKEGLAVGGHIVYIDGSSITEIANDPDSRSADSYVTLSTPKGGQYRLSLPDGSEVWLNSSSALRFPRTFDKQYREVELISGEAYFKVNPYKEEGARIPFYVKSNAQLVEVLGTEFNINTYEADEQGVVTTVAEGVVTVQALQDDNPPASDKVKLTMGKQAVLRNNGVKVHHVDPGMFVAWKDGYFYFHDADIYTVMKELERWYDIEVKYEITHSDHLFVGKIPKDVPLGTALNVLRRAGVKFEMNGSGHLIIKDK